MDGKYHTFLIYPEAHGKLRQMHLPPCVVELTMVLAVIGFATMGGLATSYARMLIKVASYNALRAEREVLRLHCHDLEETITRTSEELSSLQSLAGEVALAYSFSDTTRVHLPVDVLVVASRAASGADYDASFQTFSMMKVASPLASYASFNLDTFSKNVLKNSAIPSIWPVRGSITAGFGQRMDPFTGEGAFHRGVDIAAPSGTPIRAVADGMLFFAGREEGYGNEVLIDHGFGVTTKYGHLDTLKAMAGEEVSRGQIIGTVGMTGRATGPHLHYEVLVHGDAVNPIAYLHE